MQTLFAKSATILCALLCLCFNTLAQEPKHQEYFLLTKGQPSPLDSAVAVHIHEYRAIRIKVTYADDLIAGLNRELEKSRQEIQKHDSLAITNTATIDSQAKTIERQQGTISDLNNNFNQIVKQLPDKPKLLNSTGAKMFYGGAIVYGLLKLAKSVL